MIACNIQNKKHDSWIFILLEILIQLLFIFRGCLHRFFFQELIILIRDYIYNPGLLETGQCHLNSERSTVSSSVANYRPISITSVLSKVFERLVSICLGIFMACNGVLPTKQFAYLKGLGTCDAFFCVSHTLQSALKSGQEARIVQIDSAQPLIWSTIRAFSISSALWALEVLCCLYWHSFCQTDNSALWWIVVGVNWLTLCQKCPREVFWAHYYCSAHFWVFFQSGK